MRLERVAIDQDAWRAKEQPPVRACERNLSHAERLAGFCRPVAIRHEHVRVCRCASAIQKVGDSP